MLTIFQKIFGTFLIGITILTTLILLFIFRSIRTNYIETLGNNLLHLNRTVQFEVLPILDFGDNDRLRSTVKKLGKATDARVTIIAPDGVVLADSHIDPLKMENHSHRPEVVSAIHGKKGRSIRFSTSVRDEMMYVALPIKNNGRIIGIARVSLYLSHINESINNLTLKIVYIVFTIGFIALIAMWFLTRTLSKPVKILADASKNVARGDFEVNVKLKNKDELGELANSFNYMISQIKRLFDEEKLQKEELDSLFASLQEGFVVLDEDGMILMFNNAFKKIVKKKVEIGREYENLIQEKELLKMFKKIKKNRGSISKEIDLPDKSLLCSATYMTLKNEIIFLFSDITELKNLERIKRDIVANVSHELRTPLTAIKGFIDTLEEEIDESGRYYLEIIRRHTDRLISIVEDLLNLSELEEASTKLEYSDVNLSDICENVFKIFEQKIKEKNIKLSFSVEELLPTIRADVFKLEQALINLIDNSLKYTAEGEITVEIKKDNDIVLITVRDTGIGIPQEHQERIFERFYTVDKSRSRKLGGTGLGLSIVKHIVKLHSGDIFVKSMPGKGTKFTIQIPIINNSEMAESKNLIDINHE